MERTCSTVSSVSDIGESVLENLNATVLGYSALTKGGSRPNDLQYIQVLIVSGGNCNKSYNGTITDRMICAGLPNGGKEAC